MADAQDGQPDDRGTPGQRARRARRSSRRRRRPACSIPHYCYHPGLPVAGVCRMCLVEVEKAPKLAPVVRDVGRRRAGRARALREGARGAQGRARDAAHQPPARLPDLRSGRRVRAAGLHVPGRPRRGRAIASPSASIRSRISAATSCTSPNRCILCTRCVRFMDDVAHDPVLNVSERGDRALIGKFEGKDLTHPWAGNVIDLCPVGALLSKDSLNKARAWELDRTASVCPNCSQGCNMIVETRDNMVVRLRPRPNEDVNKYFMCDHGRLELPLDEPAGSRRRAAGAPGRRARRQPTGRSRSRAAAALLRGQARVRARVADALERSALPARRSSSRKTGGSGAFRVAAGRRSAAARRRGPRAARGSRRQRARRRAARLHAQRHAARRPAARATCSIVADEELAGVDAPDVAKARRGHRHRHDAARWARHAAAVVLPIANFAEEEGTFTNLRGRVQRFLQAKAAPGFARPSWFVLGDLLARAGRAGRTTACRATCSRRSRRAHPAFAGHVATTRSGSRRCRSPGAQTAGARA